MNRSLSWPTTVRAVLGALVLCGLVVTGLSRGQPIEPEKKGAKETPGKKPGGRKEDDDPAPPPKVVRVEEDEPKTKPGGRPADAPEIDLKLALRHAQHFAIKNLFRELATPHDVIVFRALGGVGRGQRIENVQPLPSYIADLESYRGDLALTPIDEEGKPGKSYNPTKTSVQSITHYERLAMDKVRELFEQHYDQLKPEDKKYLSRRDLLVAAEQALGAALRFHESARSHNQRRGEAWEPIEAALRKQLLDVRLEQLDDVAAARDWDQAFALTRRLAAAYPAKEDQARIARPLSEMVKKAMAGTDIGDASLREARRRLRQLEQQFPGSEVVVPIREGLQESARSLLEAAKQMGKDPKGLKRALELLAEAEETWPELPGLRAYRIQLTQSHPVLRVGVRELPRLLSPAKMATDSELRAVELLFESLVKLGPDDSGMLRYHAGLAEGRPRVVVLGRRFQLPRNATWSNGKPLTAADVRATLRLLAAGVPAGLSPAWSDLLDEKVAAGDDAYQVTLSLKQGYLDSLAPMTFKVVPDQQPSEREDFARKPVTSGPFLFEGPGSEEAREYLSFVANPNFGTRPGKRGQPYIQEVRLYATSDPVKDLETGRLQMALDLTPEQVNALRKKDRYIVPLPGPKAINRRVHFLLLNHSRPAVKNLDLRRALAYAINREKVLDECFRLGLGRDAHRALCGPFPTGSWACSPKMKGPGGGPDLFDPDKARALAQQPAAKALTATPLTLKFAEGDPAVEKALGMVRDQVREATGLTLELVKCDPRKLREEVEEVQSYDIAYYSYDYPDETYWLWPLLGPGRKGAGGNWLNYSHPDVEASLQETMGRRSFPWVKKHVQEMHELLVREMPLVPLWQLDPLMAWSRGVRPVPFDPLLVFTDIEQWHLDVE